MRWGSFFSLPERWLLAVCGCLLLVGPAARVSAGAGVELTLAERQGIERVREPVTTGIPIPKGELKDTRNVRLLRGGREVPAQFRAAGLWRPGESIRWLLVDFQAELKANSRESYTLEYGEGVSAAARPSAALRIEEDDEAYTVHTGAATFRISKRLFSLFEEVRLADGTIVVTRPRAGAPPRGAVVRGLKATVTRAVPDAANTGNSHLIYVECPDKAALEDYTLRFTSDRDYEVTGAGSGPVGKGAYMKDYTGSGGVLSIPGDAWLQYAYPKAGDVYTFRTMPQRSSAAGEGVFETAVLERGPLRSVIRVKGSFGPAAAPVLEYTAWYHFYAGSGRVKLAFTLENNDHGGRTPTGNARNADIGGINCVFFDEMTLDLPLELGPKKHVFLGSGESAEPLGCRLENRVELYQDSSGGEHWNRYRDPKFHPRPNSYVTFKGYRVFNGDSQVAAGDRALGWIDASDASKGLTVAVQDFWQNFPKSLAVDRDGCVAIGLFPGRYAGDFPFRSGEHKTHEVLLDFHAGVPSEQDARPVAHGFSDPLRLEPSQQWFAKTRALGRLHPLDTKNYRAYEIRNLSAAAIGHEVLLENDAEPPKPNLLSRREEHNFYGWMDYGDVPIDFESASGQWGMKYDMDYHMAQQYARTSYKSPRWWDLFVAGAKHTRDIDVHHQPHHPTSHFVKGGVWAHSLHSEPGHKNPHRNYNHFTKDLCFGARGTATLYYLTGDWKSHDACLEITENALARYMSPQEDPGGPEQNNRMGARGDAWTLNRLLEGYLLGGEEKYLRRARWQVRSCAFDGKPAGHKAVSLWSSVFYMMALARYVEMFPEDPAAKSYLLAHIETLRRATDPEDGIMYTITPQADGGVVGKGTCSHYNIMAADALAMGYLLTGEAKYMETARGCFAYGVKHACWKDGPPTYVQVHSANGSLHGNTFMAVDSALRGEGKLQE